MKNYSQNVDLRGRDFPRRLRDLREERHLTQADLGDKAGLSYRTVHDLELGKRERVMEKTLMLLAQALDVPLAELTGIPNGGSEGQGEEIPRGDIPAGAANGLPKVAAPAPSRRRLAPILFGTVLILLSIAGFAGWRWACSHAEWSVQGNELVVRDAVFGTRLWGIEADSEVHQCIPAPWSDQVLIVNFLARTPRGEVLEARDRAGGKVLWTTGPDLGAVEAAFGADVFAGGNILGNWLIPLDFGGETPDLLASFLHSNNFPYILCRFDRDGKLLGQYANHGHFNDHLMVDLDGNGANELVISGTNNARCYEGATVVILDADHFRGASVDSLAHPESSEPDSALVRLVLPNFPAPYMIPLEARRLHAFSLKHFPGEGGHSRFSLDVGPMGFPLGTLNLDETLAPVGFVVHDKYQEIMPSIYPPELFTETGPTDPAWLARWLAGHLRFGSRPVTGPTATAP